MKSPKRIIWALDPFMADKSVHKKVIASLKVLSAGPDVTIEPVYVITPILSLVAGYLDDLETRRQAAKKAMEKVLEKAKVRGLKPPKILVQNYQTTRTAVCALRDYAQEQNADLIVASTHGRKGVQRYFIGSFAETLYLQTDIPVLILNPNENPPRKLKVLLFPTDFSDRSKEVLDQIIPLCKEHNARLVLFHKLDLSPAPLFPFSIREELARMKASGEKWKAAINEQGVKTSFVVDDSLRDISKGVLMAAKKHKADLIAMASLSSGAVGAFFSGSVSRRIVREATVPVWLVHPKKKKKERATLFDLSPAVLEKTYLDSMEDIERDMRRNN